MCDQRFYICRHCGNIVGRIHDSGVPIVCCGEPMQALEPNVTDASAEKHVPTASVENGRVRVTIGSAPHPMTDAHSIQWVYLKTAHGGQRRCLRPGDAPETVFALADDTPVMVYAYCNLHGLWAREL